MNDNQLPHYRVTVSPRVTPERVRHVLTLMKHNAWYLEDRAIVLLLDRADAFRMWITVSSGELPQRVGIGKAA